MPPMSNRVNDMDDVLSFKDVKTINCININELPGRHKLEYHGGPSKFKTVHMKNTDGSNFAKPKLQDTNSIFSTKFATFVSFIIILYMSTSTIILQTVFCNAVRT